MEKGTNCQRRNQAAVGRHKVALAPAAFLRLGINLPRGSYRPFTDDSYILLLANGAQQNILKFNQNPLLNIRRVNVVNALPAKFDFVWVRSGNDDFGVLAGLKLFVWAR